MNIRHTPIVLLAISCLCLGMANTAHAWNPLKAKEGLSVQVTQPYIDIHTGPGKGYPVFHVLERGEYVRIFKRHTDWYKVETDKQQIGWVHRDALTDTYSQDENVLADFSRAGRLEYQQRRWELGLLGGDFSGAESITSYLGYHVTENISAELQFTQSFGEFSSAKLYTMNAVHQPWPEWWVSPFIKIGTGIIETSPNGGATRSESVLTAGGGLLIYASRNFLLRMEYNTHTVLTDRPENEEVYEWKAGFSVFF